MFLLVVGTKACEYNRLLRIGSGFKHVFFHPPGEMGEFDSHLTGCNWVCQPPLIIKDSQNNQHPSTSMLVDFDRFNVLVLPFSQLQPVSTGHVVFWHRCWLSVWRRNPWHCIGIWTKSLFTASQKKDSQMFQRVFFLRHKFWGVHYLKIIPNMNDWMLHEKVCELRIQIQRCWFEGRCVLEGKKISS